jgi:hypothetical protein
MVAASGVWSPSLYFQLTRGRTGDEMRVSAGDAVYRWKLPWGLPIAVGERRLAVEGGMVVTGSLMSEVGVADEGLCYVEPYYRGALGHFLLGYLDGHLELSLAGRADVRVIELARSARREGPGAEWSMRRIAATERVA